MLAFTGQLDEAAKIQEEIRSGQCRSSDPAPAHGGGPRGAVHGGTGRAGTLGADVHPPGTAPALPGQTRHTTNWPHRRWSIWAVCLEKLGRQEESLLVREELLLHTWEIVGASAQLHRVGHEHPCAKRSLRPDAEWRRRLRPSFLLADSPSGKIKCPSVVTRLKNACGRMVKQWLQRPPKRDF
jgi:hypothetical protein